MNVTLSRVATGGSDDGDLDVTDDLAIDGGGAVIDAAGIDGVISVADADFTIAYATLTGGVASGLTFVADNDPHELHVSDVTVRGNSAAEGGGIDLRGGSATIDRSTISGNTASARGGGIHERLGTLTITDSTVSGNRTTVTDSKGGGIYLVYGAIRVVRSTVANNVTPFWGAVYAEGADTLITVAGSALANPGPECGGPLASGGYNRIEDSSCFVMQPGDAVVSDLLLGPLADNGGETKTHLPASGSPVLDAIPVGTAGLCTTGATDQRGVTRPSGSGCDSGAVEVTP